MFCGCHTAQPTTAPLAATQNIGLRSTVIVPPGVAKITIRNNNPFPVRNVLLLVKCMPAFRYSAQPVHTFEWVIPDLIMPGNDYEISAIDAQNTAILAEHKRGSADEWIPTIEVLRVEVVRSDR